MRRLLLPACLFLLALTPASRADFPSPECCSTYPIYLCRPGYLGYPMPPRDLAVADTSGYSCRGGCGCSASATACGQITPNPYSCCFYGVTLSNYGLISPVSSVLPGGTPARLPTMPPPAPAGEKLPAPAPR